MVGDRDRVRDRGTSRVLVRVRSRPCRWSLVGRSSIFDARDASLPMPLPLPEPLTLPPPLSLPLSLPMPLFPAC